LPLAASNATFGRKNGKNEQKPQSPVNQMVAAFLFPKRIFPLNKLNAFIV